MLGGRSSTISNGEITSKKNYMKTTREGSSSAFTSLLHDVAAQFALLIRFPFMGRRRKIKYLTKALFRQIRSHR
jgi:hypothetical protein